MRVVVIVAGRGRSTMLKGPLIDYVAAAVTRIVRLGKGGRCEHGSQSRAQG